MKLSLRPQRCHRGRRDKMAPSSKQEAEAEGEVVMNIPHMEDEEVMNKEGEVDVVAMTTVAEGEEEEISTKEAGQTEVVQVEVATRMAVIEIRASSLVAIMVATAVATKVVAMVVSKHLHIQEVDTRVVATSRTIDTKMAGTMANEAEEEEGARLITKGASLNSTSNMEAISIVILDLDKEDIILVEATDTFC